MDAHCYWFLFLLLFLLPNFLPFEKEFTESQIAGMLALFTHNYVQTYTKFSCWAADKEWFSHRCLYSSCVVEIHAASFYHFDFELVQTHLSKHCQTLYLFVYFCVIGWNNTDSFSVPINCSLLRSGWFLWWSQSGLVILRRETLCRELLSLLLEVAKAPEPFHFSF